MSLGKGLESLIPPQNNSDDNQNINPANMPQAVPADEPILLPSQSNEPGAYWQNQEKQIEVPELESGKVQPQNFGDNQVLNTNDDNKDESDIYIQDKDGKKLFESKQKYQHRLHHEAVFQIETEKIRPNPHQPRRHFDESALKDLAASIREFGVIQPIIVSKIEHETDKGTEVEYELIAGERRLLASKMLGLERIPAIVRRVAPGSEQMELAIVENLQRADLSPVETARAYAKLQDEFGLTQREVASRLGKSREVIANTLRLLNLPSEIQESLDKNEINESQARMLLAIDDPKIQIQMFNELRSNKLSVRELKAKIRVAKGGKEEKQQSLVSADPEIKHLEEQLVELLGTKVKIDPPSDSEKGGKIIISFYSPEEIQGIIEKLHHQI